MRGCGLPGREPTDAVVSLQGASAGVRPWRPVQNFPGSVPGLLRKSAAERFRFVSSQQFWGSMRADRRAQRVRPPRGMSLAGFLREAKEAPCLFFLRSHFGFSLVEVLVVLLVLGILSAAGSGFYANVSRDANIRTASDSLSAFFAACRARAEQRGIPVKIELRMNRLTAIDSPSLFCPLPHLDADSLRAISGLRFEGCRALSASGEPLSRISLALTLPGGSLATFSLTLGAE